MVSDIRFEQGHGWVVRFEGRPIGSAATLDLAHSLAAMQTENIEISDDLFVLFEAGKVSIRELITYSDWKEAYNAKRKVFQLPKMQAHMDIEC